MDGDALEQTGEVRISLKLSRQLQVAMKRSAQAEERTVASWMRRVLSCATRDSSQATAAGVKS